MKLRPSLILHTSVVFLFPVGLLFSVYLLFAGHNAPGGGFIGGLVAGAAYALRFLDEGLGDDGSPMPVTPEILMGVGLVIAVAVGFGGWVAGGEFLESAYLELELAVLGQIKLGTPLLFDVGVYLIVVGLIGTVLRTFGREDVG